jgi:TonB family protein
VPAPVLSRDDRASRWGYVAAILVSALGHILFFFMILVVLPDLFSSKPTPSSYTVKIVDTLPAGELGTHLPQLNQESIEHHVERHIEHNVEHHKVAPEVVHHEAPTSITTPPPPDSEKNEIALNTAHSPTPTPMRTPTPTPTPRQPLPQPTTVPTRHPVKHGQAKPTPTPTPHARRHKPNAMRSPEMAEATPKPTPNIGQEMRNLHEKLMAEHLKEMKEASARNRGNGRPVLASRETEGRGYGVGAGTGSSGILQSAEFLLYCQTIKKRIQDAWNFAGTNSKLTATVTVGINSDGSLNAVRVSDASQDPAFDDSVVRAIRLAAPFPPPPEKYRDQFADGVPVIFNLGALENNDSGG